MIMGAKKGIWRNITGDWAAHFDPISWRLIKAREKKMVERAPSSLDERNCFQVFKLTFSLSWHNYNILMVVVIFRH